MHFQEFKRDPSPRMGYAQKPGVFRRRISRLPSPMVWLKREPILPKCHKRLSTQPEPGGQWARARWTSKKRSRCCGRVCGSAKSLFLRIRCRQPFSAHGLSSLHSMLAFCRDLCAHAHTPRTPRAASSVAPAREPNRSARIPRPQQPYADDGGRGLARRQ